MRRRRELPPVSGAWHVEETLWGESQRVRLTTGPPSLVQCEEHVRSVHAVAFHSEGILIVQNRDGSWTFPGGRLEGGETLHDALGREMWEEARARLLPDYQPLAATRIDFVNRVPGRVYRVHPTYLLWVIASVEELSDEPHHDPANAVVARRLVEVDEARQMLPTLEQRVLSEALPRPGGGAR